jgi:hypothetical protein
MNGICASDITKLSHHCIVFHIDQITARWIRVPSTATVTVVIPTSVSDQCSECLRNTIACSGNGNIFVTPSGIEVCTCRVAIIIESDHICTNRIGEKSITNLKEDTKRYEHLLFHIG